MSQINSASAGTGAPPIEQITPSAGIVVVPDGSGNINMPGTLPIVTTGTANTLTISVNAATTSDTGVVELATNAETITGTDSTRAVVPLGLQNKLGTQLLNAVPYGGGSTAAINWMTPGTDGQLIIGATAANPMFGTLTSMDSSIAFATGPNMLDLSVASATGITWNNVTLAAQSMAVNNGYVVNSASQCTLTLPATAAIGDLVRVVGRESNGWLIAQNAGQTIHFNSSDTTTGVPGQLVSTNRYNSVELVCVTADTDFTVASVSGSLTIV